MQKVKLVGIVALALLALGAFGASAAFAESPELLILSGSVEELEGTLKAPAGSEIAFVQLTGEKTFTAAGAEAKLKNCLPIGTDLLNTTLCHDVPLDITGYKQEKAACRSENAKGEKDPVETILMLLDLHLAAEEVLPGNDELQPLLIFKILGTGLEEEVKYNLRCD